MTHRLWPVVLVAVLASVPVHAASYLDRAYGTPELGLSARARAMGGAGSALANGAASLIDNPAALALERGHRLDLVGGVIRNSENRFVPLFDTFDSFVDEAAIAINDHTYGSVNGGVVVDPKLPMGVMLAAGVFDRYDPRYDYRDERRTTQTTDQIVAERFIRTRGTVRDWALGAAMPVQQRGRVGVSLHWYDGTISDRDALVPHASTASGRVSAFERRLSGFSATLGGTYDWNERLRTALACETPPQLHDDYTAWENDSVVSAPRSSEDLHLPWRLQAGAVYRPRNTYRTEFAMDVIYTPWSNTDDPLRAGANLLDTWDVRFGLEHQYVRGLPARIGFRYARSYAMREADRVAFTFGMGYRMDRVSLDLAGEVTKANSRQEPLWPRDQQASAIGAGRDRVEDTALRVFFGVRVAP